MSLQKLPDQQIHPVCQTTLAFLEREDVHVPGPMIEAIVSVKSLLRAVLSNQLHICSQVAAAAPTPEEPAPTAAPPEKKPAAAKKKAA